MNPRLLKDITTPGTALIAKHAGWSAAQAGKEAWIIDSGATGEKWFDYTCCENTASMRRVRKRYCEKLRQGKIL